MDMANILTGHYLLLLHHSIYKTLIHIYCVGNSNIQSSMKITIYPIEIWKVNSLNLFKLTSLNLFQIGLLINIIYTLFDYLNLGTWNFEIEINQGIKMRIPRDFLKIYFTYIC